jgi:hypothetical protein
MNPLNCQVYNQQAWGGFTLISGTSSARYVTDPDVTEMSTCNKNAIH